MILDGCYFTGLVWFWLIYAKVSGCIYLYFFEVEAMGSLW
ncbi:hypothetical protein [uncultured Gammaproteobacteria bacterium]|nr:hypothetical protein [uncultured Gammaproteobacteria bacterium]